jgi:hypothetical protein
MHELYCAAITFESLLENSQRRTPNPASGMPSVITPDPKKRRDALGALRLPFPRAARSRRRRVAARTSRASQRWDATLRVGE